MLNRSGAELPSCHEHRNRVRSPGLVAAPFSPPSRRPAQRGRGVWHRHKKKVPFGTKTLAEMTSTPPPSYRISRGRPPPFRPNPPSELAQNKGNTNGLSYPRGCADPVLPMGRPSGCAVLPCRANCALKTPGQVRVKDLNSIFSTGPAKFSTGPAKRRPSEARTTDGQSDRFDDDEERDVSGDPRE